MVIFYVQASTLNLLEMLRFGICYPDNKNFKYVKEKRRETLAEKLQPLTVLAFYSIIVVKSHLKRQADQHLSSSLAITCMWFTACILTFPKQKMKHYLLRIDLSPKSHSKILGVKTLHMNLLRGGKSTILLIKRCWSF